MLCIQSTENPGSKTGVPRGYNAVLTDDSRYAVFKIRPLYAETREARIKKKKPEDMPKDSIGIVELGKTGVVKAARVKSFKMPDKAGGWVAFQKEKDLAGVRPSALPTQKTVDSLQSKVDSLTVLVVQLKNAKAGNRDAADADEDPAANGNGTDATDLVLRNLFTGKEKVFKNVGEYSFSKNGQKLAMRLAKEGKDSNSRNAVAVYDTRRDLSDTILRGGNDFRSFAFSEDGSQLAFLAERDTSSKALQKFYGLYLYHSGSDSAQLLVHKTSVGMPLGMTVSENGAVSFSRSGRRLLFGLAPIQPPKDTTLVDFELAKLDIWHYQDDYLQTQQLYNLQNELKRSYLAVFDFGQNKLISLGSPGLPNVLVTADGDGENFVGITDTGRRVQLQWQGATVKDVYAVNAATGEKKLVKKAHEGDVFHSAAGKAILLYDNKSRQYFAWTGKELKNISAKLPFPVYDEESDVPGDPDPYGVLGWHEGDSAVYVYDRFDVWKLSPSNLFPPQKLTAGRSENNVYRFLRVDTASRFVSFNQSLYFRVFNKKNKWSALVQAAGNGAFRTIAGNENAAYTSFLKARNSDTYLFSKESFVQSPDLYVATGKDGSAALQKNGLPATKLTSLNPQQSNYNWGTAELYKWKTFNGKESTGILYKPEDFDPGKKYPMLVYFYEKLSDGLNNYLPPAPTPSRLNIPFFVSRGYLVFAPDISYTKGHPGKDAYNYIVSGAQALARNSWVDGNNIGIQGQSWGGYQVAYLITATKMFKAAWAGAPVVNMFSAYGGIRWESGLNRQFQYEKSQSRIGATPWERPDLYIENSPFFHLKNVTTPLVIMSNDADGAVPWYQGIEFFTAMRRLGKKVWLLNYNGEAHNLVERRNRKDIQVREQQYFDWLLKGAEAPKWLTEGVPAVKKGRDWGLGF